MGYTHYWNFKKNPKDIENGDKKFKKAVSLIKKGIKKIPQSWKNDDDDEVVFKLCGANGTGEPVFTDTEVAFNGDAKTNNHYESCVIKLDYEKYYSFDFCKTARRPYDVAVCLTLLCFKKAFGEDFKYSSDGNITSGEEGWKLANEIIKQLK